jgi:hypothetical protein
MSIVSVWGVWFISVMMHLILVYRFGMTGETERRRQEGEVSYYDSEHLLPMHMAPRNNNSPRYHDELSTFLCWLVLLHSLMWLAGMCNRSKALEPSDSPMLRAAIEANQRRPIGDIILSGMADLRRVMEALTTIAFITLIGFTGVVTVMNINHARS